MRTALATCVVAAASLLPVPTAAAGEPQRAFAADADNIYWLQPVKLLADPSYSSLRVPPPYEFFLQEKGVVAAKASISIDYLPAGPGLINDTCTTWPEQARTAFTYAVNVWASQLASSLPITVKACWADNMEAGVLGHAAALTSHRNFANAPASNTWYPAALANALSGTDVNGAEADIYAAFSSTFTWYLGTDGNPAATQHDFVSVVLHEVGHGLGFAGSMTVSNGLGSWGGGSGYAYAYDRFTENGSAQALLNTTLFPNGSAALATQLQSDAVYFNGSNARAANAGSRVPLYAPASWSQGSSYSHLAESYNNTPNALMTYSLARGESIHDPGPVVLGLMRDLGWTASSGQQQYALTVTRTGSGTVTSSPAGIDCGTTCSANFAAGSAVTLTATPAAGSTFTGWTGSGCSGTGACSLTMDAAKAVGAVFTAQGGSRNLLVNGDFESGRTGWTESSNAGSALIVNLASAAHGGSWYALLGGGDSLTESLWQDVAIPASAQRAALRFWYRITTNEATTSTVYDRMQVTLRDAATGATLATLATYSNLTATSAWLQTAEHDLTPYKGSTVRVHFSSTTDASAPTWFRLDDVTLLTETASDTLSLSSTLVDFGGHSMFTASGPRDVILTNTGGANVIVSSISASGPFAATHNCGTLPAGSTCSAIVTFLPRGEGALTGTLSIASSAGARTVALAGTGERSLVTHYYRTILRRDPDAGGKAFWIAEAARVSGLGANVNEAWFAMAMSFYNSAEYATFGRNPTQYVSDLYTTFFNRSADSAGLAYWTGQMASGMPREVVLVAFMFSSEFTTFARTIFGNVAVRAEVDTVVDFYRGLLARLPDSSGFDYWVGRFRAAQCQGSAAVSAQAEAISSAYASSTEYQARNRSNAQYVGDLYNAFLRRGGDLGGVSFWIGQLDSGARTREQVRREFVASAEFSARVAAIVAQGCALTTPPG